MNWPNHILAVVQSDLQMIFALRRFLESEGFPSFGVARNDEEAILYLRGVGVYEDRFRYPLPSILILDSDSKDGCDLEVLSWVRGHPGYQNLPVTILCREKHAEPHVTCVLDNHSVLVERGNFTELGDALKNIQAIETLATR